MRELKLSFRRHGLLYTQLKRNDVVALYSVGGTYSDNTSFYEVCKIYTRNDRHGLRESLPTNEVFGRDRSRHFNNYTAACNYFDELTTILKQAKRVPKVVTAVEEKNIKVCEDHPIEEFVTL
jgi:hypothetical protein